MQLRPSYGRWSKFSKWRPPSSWISPVKFDVTWSRGRPVSTSQPNLVKISRRAAELCQFMCFQNGDRPPSWIFAELKFGGISVSGTSVLVSEPNFVRICAIVTELWPFKWIFKMAAVCHLELLFGYSGPSKVFLLTWSLCSNFVSIGFIFAKISPIEHFTSLA